MTDDAGWSEFLTGIELIELKLAGVFGQIRELADPEQDPLPDEWDVNVHHAYLVEDEHLRVRVIAEAKGPSGRLIVDAMGVFTSAKPLADVAPATILRFVNETGFAAVVPTVRASYQDLNQRLELDAPRLGLFKFPVEEPTEGE